MPAQPPAAAAVPTPLKATLAATMTVTATPVIRQSDTPTLAPTNAPIYFDALAWNSEPVVPIILYHQFIPDINPLSSKTKLRLGDFRNQLESLYNAGYSLVPLNQWLKGNLSVPPGRRPLILTMDDAFFASQIFLNPDGTPSPKSGIGVLWQFSKDHPDFGFSAALFSNLGDKLYANIDLGSVFINEGDWKPSLEQVLVWGIQHNVMPYNHLYHHPRLDLTEGKYITSEIKTNDVILEKFLKLASREDLISSVDNIIALPYSIWPPSKGGKAMITGYRNPLDQPVLAVLEAGYYHDEHNLAYSPYSPHFDRYHIPRITMNTLKSVDYLVNLNDHQVPAARPCRLGPLDSTQTQDAEALSVLIKSAISAGQCQPGYYQVKDIFFDASGASIKAVVLPPLK